MKPQFWSVRMFAALWGLMFAQLAPALADSQVTITRAAAEGEPIVQFEWSNVIGGDAVTFLHAIPEVMKLVEADEDEILAAQLIVKAIELIGKGKGHASLNSFEMAPGADEPKIEFQISLDLGDRLPTMLEIIDQVIEHEDAADDLEQVDVSGVAFTHAAKDVEFFWGTTDGRFLFSTSEGGAKELIEDAKRKTPGASSDLSRVRAKVGANPDSSWMLSTYMNVPAIIETVRKIMIAEDELPPKFDAIVDELGLKGLRSVYVHADDVNGGPVSRTLLETDGTRKGFLSFWDQKPLERADLELIPQDAHWAVACNFDLEQTWNKTRQAIEALDPNVAMQIDAGLGMVSAMVGIDPVHQVLPAFGDTWVIYDAPDHGGLLITGAVMVVEVDGPDALNAAVAQLCTMVSPMLMQAGYELVVKETTYQGHVIKYIVLPGLPVPISPAAAYVDGRVVVGLSPQVVKVALHQADPALRKSSILDHADVMKLAGDPSGKAQSFYYWDLKHQARFGYKLSHLLRTAAASLLAGNADETDIADLPTLPELLADAKNYSATCTVVGDDILYEEKGSLFLWDAALGYFSVTTTAMAVSILLPSLSRARELAKRAVNASNLRGIGQAVHIYANDHDDQFPPDFDALINWGMISREMLTSPRHDGEGVAFVYVKGQNENDDVRNVLAYERLVGDEGTNVLFLDGHVEWMDELALEQALQATKERLGSRAEEIETGGGEE